MATRAQQPSLKSVVDRLRAIEKCHEKNDPEVGRRFADIERQFATLLSNLGTLGGFAPSGSTWSEELFKYFVRLEKRTESLVERDTFFDTYLGAVEGRHAKRLGVAEAGLDLAQKATAGLADKVEPRLDDLERAAKDFNERLVSVENGTNEQDDAFADVIGAHSARLAKLEEALPFRLGIVEKRLDLLEGTDRAFVGRIDRLEVETSDLGNYAVRLEGLEKAAFDKHEGFHNRLVDAEANIKRLGQDTASVAIVDQVQAIRKDLIDLQARLDGRGERFVIDDGVAKGLRDLMARVSKLERVEPRSFPDWVTERFVMPHEPGKQYNVASTPEILKEFSAMLIRGYQAEKDLAALQRSYDSVISFYLAYGKALGKIIDPEHGKMGGAWMQALAHEVLTRPLASRDGYVHAGPEPEAAGQRAQVSSHIAKESPREPRDHSIMLKSFRPLGDTGLQEFVFECEHCEAAYIHRAERLPHTAEASGILRAWSTAQEEFEKTLCDGHPRPQTNPNPRAIPT